MSSRCSGIGLPRAFAIVALFIVGCSKEPPPPPAEAPRAGVMHPAQEKLTPFAEFNGWLAANEKQEVRSRVRGHIKAVDFENGQKVTKGKLLFVIDPRPFEADIAVARANVSSAEAQVV